MNKARGRARVPAASTSQDPALLLPFAFSWLVPALSAPGDRDRNYLMRETLGPDLGPDRLRTRVYKGKWRGRRRSRHYAATVLLGLGGSVSRDPQGIEVGQILRLDYRR